MREILFVVGEPSGDLHASSVARELVARGAPFRLRGIGGDLMQSAGVEIDEHIRDLAVLGFVEIIRHIPKHWQMLNAMRARITSGNVALVVLVDYPGFNMRVAEIAAEARVPVLYYIVPQVWAWGAGRLEKLASWVKKAAVILPFEEDLLRQHGIDATFVGHPLLDKAVNMPSRPAARAELGLAADRRVLALFPGSRAQEIERHLDPFVATARMLQERDPSLQVVVSAAPHVRIDPARCPFPVVAQSSFGILRAADAAMCKSGTTTLEASVAGCPHVVAYRTHPLTYFAARRLVKIPRIGLVNVVAGKEVAREFVQDALEPAVVADALETLLDETSPARQRMVSDLAEVKRLLGAPGAARRVAEIAEALAGHAAMPQ
ncbi:MAG TPA: lipid-A-disaccharide synthase [Gemmatimonadaceae bacterium]|nr:lipid-A-disaccharide synthase [Gemmatimonadaceae bacterium]